MSRAIKVLSRVAIVAVGGYLLYLKVENMALREIVRRKSDLNRRYKNATSIYFDAVMAGVEGADEETKLKIATVLADGALFLGMTEELDKESYDNASR